MLYWHNKLSGMTHIVEFPSQGYFIEAECGARLHADDKAFESAHDICTCTACRLNMELKQCQPSSLASA